MVGLDPGDLVGDRAEVAAVVIGVGDFPSPDGGSPNELEFLPWRQMLGTAMVRKLSANGWRC